MRQFRFVFTRQGNMARRMETRINFLKLFEATRNISASARSVGISRATANRWLTKARKTQAAINTQETSEPQSVENALVDLIRQHPTWSSQRYAHALSTTDIELSSRTIQRQLNKLDLGRKMDRISAVESWSVRAGEIMQPSVRQELRKAGRPIDGTNFRASYPGNILAFGSYKWLRRRTEYSHVIVAIDLYSLTVRAELWDGLNFETPIHTYLAITEFIRRKCFLKDPMTVTARGAFSKIGGIQFIPHFTNTGSKTESTEHFRAIDSTVNYVLGLMRKEVIPTLRTFANTDNGESIKKTLRDWECKYNLSHVNPGFPNFGLTPWQVIARTAP